MGRAITTYIFSLLTMMLPLLTHASSCTLVTELSTHLTTIRSGESNLPIEAPSELKRLKRHLDLQIALHGSDGADAEVLRSKLNQATASEIKNVLTALSGIEANGAEKAILWRRYASVLSPFLERWANHWRELVSGQTIFTGLGDHLLLIERDGRMWRGQVSDESDLQDIKFGRVHTIDPASLKLWEIRPNFKAL